MKRTIFALIAVVALGLVAGCQSGTEAAPPTKEDYNEPAQKVRPGMQGTSSESTN